MRILRHEELTGFSRGLTPVKELRLGTGFFAPNPGINFFPCLLQMDQGWQTQMLVRARQTTNRNKARENWGYNM